MSVADKDGRIAQVVSDLHTCLSMSLHESIRENSEALRRMIDTLAADEGDG